LNTGNNMTGVVSPRPALQRHSNRFCEKRKTSQTMTNGGEATRRADMPLILKPRVALSVGAVIA